MTYAQQERTALAELLHESGPDGPTLCEGWQTRGLAAPLVRPPGRLHGARPAAVPRPVLLPCADRDVPGRAAVAVPVRDPRGGRGGQYRGGLRPPRGRAARASRLDGARAARRP